MTESDMISQVETFPGFSRDCDRLLIDQSIQSFTNAFHRLQTLVRSDLYATKNSLRRVHRLTNGHQSQPENEEEKNHVEHRRAELNETRTLSSLDLPNPNFVAEEGNGSSQSPNFIRQNQHTYRKKLTQHDIQQSREQVQKQASAIGSSISSSIRPGDKKNNIPLLSTGDDEIVSIIREKDKYNDKCQPSNINFTPTWESDANLRRERLRQRLSRARDLIRSTQSLLEGNKTKSTANFSPEFSAETVTDSNGIPNRNEANSFRVKNLKETGRWSNADHCKSSESHVQSRVVSQRSQGSYVPEDDWEKRYKETGDMPCHDPEKRPTRGNPNNCRRTHDLFGTNQEVDYQSRKTKQEMPSAIYPPIDPLPSRVIPSPNNIILYSSVVSSESESEVVDNCSCDDISDIHSIDASIVVETESASIVMETVPSTNSKVPSPNTTLDAKRTSPNLVSEMERIHLFCNTTNNEEQNSPSDKDCGQKSFSTEQLSTHSDSSFEVSVSPTTQANRVSSSKVGEPKKFESTNRTLGQLSLLFSCSKSKSANKEWLWKANATEGHVRTSKRDIKMEKWLARIDEAEQLEDVQQLGPYVMEAVFYD
mmetsp:Transcript_5169/g.15045  ORF Transcript_5169/g.15045 Transcript_5169/m.15045 type:complete len:594 (-) Transcript_5169:484-2265(-)|eukprot:CAMPEP_0172367382 /NCGR_PEP_ID=MMETSP1060-20121228/21043_1 /TAXON_ID=37318 /ORGANISM="Pseudo-nitzschia pungens, Strain cf. cingulata" /LENGTH=593 /DNA_ID=CAMNT_0013091609 /DNA_START=156 /DNA_END=1937 /DNA_ORIENTATION=-